jgi:superfamily II DNA or RNA helicase
VLDEAIEFALFGTAPISIVKSPPGAGKTFLVECATAVAVAQPAMRVVVVTPGVSQLYDIGRRLLEYRFPRIELGACQAPRPARTWSGGSTHRRLGPNLNIGPGVVVANAHLLAAYLHRLGTGAFDLMIVDEAYQLSAADFMPIAELATAC